jgi:hypothetical protein
VGTLVFARPGVKRTAFAEEAGTTLLVLGGTPGKAYEPDGWEVWAPLNPLYQSGRYEEAADRGRELVEAHPGYTALIYNVACCESLAGRAADAIDHLGPLIDRHEGGPRDGCPGLRLRPDSGRARVQGARGLIWQVNRPALLRTPRR